VAFVKRECLYEQSTINGHTSPHAHAHNRNEQTRETKIRSKSNKEASNTRNKKASMKHVQATVYVGYEAPNKRTKGHAGKHARCYDGGGCITKVPVICLSCE
jgi:hypothetical protein